MTKVPPKQTNMATAQNMVKLEISGHVFEIFPEQILNPPNYHTHGINSTQQKSSNLHGNFLAFKMYHSASQYSTLCNDEKYQDYSNSTNCTHSKATYWK